MKNVIGKLNVLDLALVIIGLCVFGTGFVSLFKSYSLATSVINYIAIGAMQLIFATCFALVSRVAVKLGSDNK